MIRWALVGFLLLSSLGSAASKLDELRNMVAGKESNVISVTQFNTYKKLVTTTDRNYDVFVLMSASKSVGCNLCSAWEEAFQDTAKAYKAQLEGRDESIFFMQVKYDSNPDVFRLYNLNHAPLIYYIAHDLKDPEKSSPKNTMNLAQMDTPFPDPIANFVSQRSGHKVEIIYPVWPKLLTLFGLLVFLAVAGRSLALVFVPLLRRFKWFWFIFSLVLYGLGVSGSIFSYLRNVPNYGLDKNRKPVYFAGDRNQYFYEGIIIWGLLVGGATFLVFSAYGVLPSPKAVRPLRPILNMLSLVVFGLMFRMYVGFYVRKANWYRYGMTNSLTFPWIS